MRNLAGKVNIKDEISPSYYLSAPASSCHKFFKYGKNHDSILARRNERVPEHLNSPKIPDEDCSPKKFGTAQARWVFNPRNNSFLEDGSLEKCLVSKKAPSTFGKNIISIDDVLWDWPDGSFDGSAIMDLESPPTTLESTASTQISHDHKLEGSSMEFEVTPKKIISSAGDELINQSKESSNRCRCMKQETMRKSMTSAMASTSNDSAGGMKPKVQKQVNGLTEDEKRKRELPMLRSSLPVKTSLLGRVKAKKKVDAVVEPGITNEKSPTLDKTVEAVKRKQAGVTPLKGPCTSLSPIIVKKKTLSPPKRIQLSPKPALLLKTESPVIKYWLPVSASGRIIGQSSQERSKIVRNSGISKLGEKKVSKQSAASQAPKSTVNYAPGLNNRKLRSVKNQLEAGKVNGVKKKTLHVVEQKLDGVALNFAEQKHTKLRSQQSSRTLSSRTSISSSAFVSSSYKEENGGSQLTIRDVSGSKKTQIVEGKGRTSLCSKKSDYKKVQKRTTNVSLKDKSLSPDKMSFRRGKEVSPQREGPDQGRLGFMQAKAVSEDENFEGEIGMSSFRKSRESTTASSATPSPGSPTVVPRHKETSNKLVETRKSRVKALVSAFESILSPREKCSVSIGLSIA